MPVGIRNDELLDMLQGEFQRRYEPNFAWGNAISAMSLLPGLRGLWPMSSVDENGNALDLSGKGLTLAYTGNPTYNSVGLAPYIDLDGVGDYLVRNDEAALDIVGTEAYIANKGLTFGGWFWLDVLGASRALISKWDGNLNQRSYIILWDIATSTFKIVTSSTGVNLFVADSGFTGTTGQWYYVVGRYIPSTELAVFVNRLKVTNLVGIPATTFSGSAPFSIGCDFTGGAAQRYLDGRASLGFLCASALPDTIIKSIFEQTRALYGVK